MPFQKEEKRPANNDTFTRIRRGRAASALLPRVRTQPGENIALELLVRTSRASENAVPNLGADFLESAREN